MDARPAHEVWSVTMETEPDEPMFAVLQWVVTGFLALLTLFWGEPVPGRRAFIRLRTADGQCAFEIYDGRFGGTRLLARSVDHDLHHLTADEFAQEYAWARVPAVTPR